MEDFYIGGASVKLFQPIFKMKFPEIVDIALAAEGVFHNLVFVSIRKTHGASGDALKLRKNHQARF
jgi:4-hydroxy-3-polyprenylbenzoate decarboxylase